MPNPRLSNWCTTCEEACHDHPTVCTICGEELKPHPSASTNSAARPSPRSEGDFMSAAAAMRLLNEAAGGGGGGDDAAMQQQLISMMNDTGNNNPGMGEEVWEQPPPEALDPTAAGRKNRPASKECVDRIPRIQIDAQSSILHEACVECVPPPPPSGGGRNTTLLQQRGATLSSDAIVGEFGKKPPYQISGRIVLADPITGRGGLKKNQQQSDAGLFRGGAIAYFERGGSVTFARKAIMAQEAGASAVVVGNNVSVWPYVMKDSKNEANANAGLVIPVVMLKRSDGALLRKMTEENHDATVRCTVRATRRDEDNTAGGGCIICRDNFAIGDTVIRLPFCSHVFHEKCALSWLNRHNTCPTCRRELPTDDAEYEQERRRVSRTHAGVGDGSGNSNGSNHWEDLFG